MDHLVLQGLQVLLGHLVFLVNQRFREFQRSRCLDKHHCLIRVRLDRLVHRDRLDRLGHLVRLVSRVCLEFLVNREYLQCRDIHYHLAIDHQGRMVH